MERSVVLRSAAIVAAGLLLRHAAPAAAQVVRVNTSSSAAKLIVVPFGRSDGDSAASVQVADGLRDRLRQPRYTQFDVVARAIMNENLQGSGFPIDVPLDPAVARQLARFLNARILVDGDILRAPGDSVLVVARLSEMSGNPPQSASAFLKVARGRANGAVGSQLAGRLADAQRSFEAVQQCNRHRETNDYRRALEAADRALRTYPDNAGAHLCVAQVYRAQRLPSDSILSALRRANDADSLNSLVLRQLAGVYQETGDTANLFATLARILRVDVGDNDLRIRVVQQLIIRFQADSALVVVDEGLARNPNQVELLKARSLAAAALAQSVEERGPRAEARAAARRHWLDAAQTLAHVAEIDSANIDSLFLSRIMTYQQRAADTTGLLEWTRIATVRSPTTASYWYQLALLLRAKDDTTAAVGAIRRYLALDTTAARARGSIVLASYLLEMREYDSALAQGAAAAESDPSLAQSAAQIYFAVGARALQEQSWSRAAELLGQAKTWADGSLLARISFYLGLAELQLAVAADTEAQTNRSCDAARREAELLTSARADITAGVTVDRAQASQMLQAVDVYEQRATAFQRNFCR